VRQGFAPLPVADEAQLLVAGQSFRQIAGARQIVNRFGDKRASNSVAVVWRPAVPALRRRDEAAQRNQFESRYQTAPRFAEFRLIPTPEPETVPTERSEDLALKKPGL
jgi:hypothetical protein